jgi:hypothetical protein
MPYRHCVDEGGRLCGVGLTLAVVVLVLLNAVAAARIAGRHAVGPVSVVAVGSTTGNQSVPVDTTDAGAAPGGEAFVRAGESSRVAAGPVVAPAVSPATAHVPVPHDANARQGDAIAPPTPPVLTNPAEAPVPDDPLASPPPISSVGAVWGVPDPEWDGPPHEVIRVSGPSDQDVVLVIGGHCATVVDSGAACGSDPPPVLLSDRYMPMFGGQLSGGGWYFVVEVGALAGSFEGIDRDGHSAKGTLVGRWGLVVSETGPLEPVVRSIAGIPLTSAKPSAETAVDGLVAKEAAI